ncbi:nitrogen permease regulator 2 [Ophiobolus disseminans]|uniref:Nitrogen permease regulator 2 n=1 Tax=Ophiobolus disseminans TaxID=1469910 RepID=A0A6A6ZIL6_9PLEO|nr:nitrogen permease regulator 2 [Ophiobolus disseminans]
MPTRAIEAIFYTRFHHEKGSRVLHQVPPNSIVPRRRKPADPDAAPESPPLFDFASTSQNFIIPNQQFCDRLLTFCVNHHRVIGYPVCIKGERYSRNEFIFNFAIVVGENELDWACYGEVVRKLGRLLRGLEEQDGFLSREEEGVWEGDNEGEDGVFGEEGGSGGKMYALCEMVLEDLNNYAECMIPIDDSNTINLKLFPTRPPPPPILAHQVPVLTISLATLQSPISSDLTLNRVLPYINGVNSIARIAQLADTDLSLTRRAVQHLVYYGCLVLLDIFSFGAIYACTAEIGAFVIDDAVKDECARYVRAPRARSGLEEEHISLSSSLASPTTNPDPPPHTQPPQTNDAYLIDHSTLILLYTSLRQGLTLKKWVLSHPTLLQHIDVRRLITFGIIKGFLYRVHKYALATSTTPSTSLPPAAPPTSLAASAVNIGGTANVGVGNEMGPSVYLHRPSTTPHVTDAERGEALPLLRFLDGMHCFDEICTELCLAERVVEGRVRGMGEGVGIVIQR